MEKLTIEARENLETCLKAVSKIQALVEQSPKMSDIMAPSMALAQKEAQEAREAINKIEARINKMVERHFSKTDV